MRARRLPSLAHCGSSTSCARTASGAIGSPPSSARLCAVTSSSKLLTMRDPQAAGCGAMPLAIGAVAAVAAIASSRAMRTAAGGCES